MKYTDVRGGWTTLLLQYYDGKILVYLVAQDYTRSAQKTIYRDQNRLVTR